LGTNASHGGDLQGENKNPRRKGEKVGKGVKRERVPYGKRELSGGENRSGRGLRKGTLLGDPKRKKKKKKQNQKSEDAVRD